MPVPWNVHPSQNFCAYKQLFVHALLKFKLFFSRGSFEIMGTTLMDGSYEGLQAHPPRKVHVKAAKVFKEIPRLLQFKLHPRSDVYVENFNRLCPTKDDIALYFLPGDDERFDIYLFVSFHL